MLNADMLRAHFPGSVQGLIDGIAEKVLQISLPLWLQHELHSKLLIVINHVLMNEPAATERLRRQQGKCVQFSWRNIRVQWRISAAGLFELLPASETVPQDLQLQVLEERPSELARMTLMGDKPAMRIEGDVLLAADMNWLVDHVYWDIEEDIARLVGDVQAHRLLQWCRSGTQALREYLQRHRAASSPAHDSY